MCVCVCVCCPVVVVVGGGGVDVFCSWFSIIILFPTREVNHVTLLVVTNHKRPKHVVFSARGVNTDSKTCVVTPHKS